VARLYHSVQCLAPVAAKRGHGAPTLACLAVSLRLIRPWLSRVTPTAAPVEGWLLREVSREEERCSLAGADGWLLWGALRVYGAT